MRKLTFSKAAQLAEIVAAVAVVISLIYVGLQLRADTAAIRSSSLQTITGNTSTVLEMQAANPELMRIRRKGDVNPEELDDDQAFQYYISLPNFLAKPPEFVLPAVGGRHR